MQLPDPHGPHCWLLVQGQPWLAPAAEVIWAGSVEGQRVAWRWEEGGSRQKELAKPAR